jgi:predicted ABC-type ATPase
MTKRLRVIAGPNGSGKSTWLDKIKSKVELGIYVNADEIEKTIKEKGVLNLENYKIKTSNKEFIDFINNEGFSALKLSNQSKFIQKNTLKISDIDSYIASDIAAFIREKLLLMDISFSFETVMSHPEKLKFIEKAKDKGYRIYLYFVGTEHPSININRVQIRVSANGHYVEKSKITARYYRTMEMLHKAIKLTNRAYLLDNTNSVGILFAEITEGKTVDLLCNAENIPQWFLKYK